MRKSLVYARNFSIAIVTLGVVGVGAGAAYTWWVGQQTPDPNAFAQPVQPQALNKKVKQAVQDPNAAVSASVQSISSPVSPGDNAVLTVRSTQNTTCTIKVEYNKVVARDSGLVDKETDNYGMVSWSWTVEPSAPYGKWPVDVTCKRNEKSAVVSAELELKSKADISE